MEQIENRVLELVRAVCRAHRQDNYYPYVVNTLHNDGIDVSTNFVRAICNRLPIETDKYMTSYHQNAKKTLYYELERKCRTYIRLWSERYFFIYTDYPYGRQMNTFHSFDVFDTFNDKSM
jgi:hypothetical protein